MVLLVLEQQLVWVDLHDQHDAVRALQHSAVAVYCNCSSGGTIRNCAAAFFSGCLASAVKRGRTL
jgi:hypothetical protein